MQPDKLPQLCSGRTAMKLAAPVKNATLSCFKTQKASFQKTKTPKAYNQNYFFRNIYVKPPEPTLPLMKYYFITGTGKGIGKALAEALLSQAEVTVIGVSRRQTISHPRYQHHNLDLGQLQNLTDKLPEIFPDVTDAEELVLVNNAGVIGEIGYVGEKEAADFNYIFTVNVTAPAILMNAFLGRYRNQQIPKRILNISSGAGKYPLDGWAGYCASKAALDLFSQTVQEEQNLRKSGVKVFSIAPGIVDTQMQAQIRSTPASQFSKQEKFQEYKSSGSLASPETVGAKLLKLLQSPPEGLPVVSRLE